MRNEILSAAVKSPKRLGQPPGLDDDFGRGVNVVASSTRATLPWALRRGGRRRRPRSAAASAPWRLPLLPSAVKSGLLLQRHHQADAAPWMTPSMTSDRARTLASTWRRRSPRSWIRNVRPATRRSVLLGGPSKTTFPVQQERPGRIARLRPDRRCSKRRQCLYRPGRTHCQSSRREIGSTPTLGSSSNKLGGASARKPGRASASCRPRACRPVDR